MGQRSVSIPKLKQLEAQLDLPKPSPDQLSILERLVGYYIYTDISKAMGHLQKMEKLIGQDVPDEFQLAYHWYAAQLHNQLYRFESSNEHFAKAIDIINRIGDISQLAEVLVDQVGTQINLGDWQSASTNLAKVDRLVEQFPDEIIDYRLRCRHGFLNLHLSSLPEALEALIQAEQMLDELPKTPKLKDYYFLCLIQAGIGNIYQRTGDLQKAAQSYVKVVDLCETLGMKTRLSWHYLNVGNSFLGLEQLPKAEQFFRKALESDDDLSRKARAGAYANLGYISFSKADYSPALELFEQAEKLYRENAADDFHNFSVIANWKARLFAAQGDVNDALEQFKIAFHNAEKGKDFKQLAEVCLEIGKFYAEQTEFEMAYQYQLMHSQMEQSYREQQNQQRIRELEVKYKAEAQQREAEMLRLEASRLALKALRAQMNPHFLHNCLNAIQRFITSEDTDTAARYLAKFSRLMRQSLEYSEQEIISLEEEMEFLQNYLEIFQKLRFEQFDYTIKVDDELEEDIVGIPTMIIQPYVENALEHGLRSRTDGKVTVEFIYLNEEQLKCVVTDNGIGRTAAAQYKATQSEQQQHRSMGTRITEERLEILNRTQGKQVSVQILDLQDDSGSASGTRVEILLPVEYLQKNLVTAF